MKIQPRTIFHMAFKDIRLIARDRLGLFFIAVFPILMGLFFGTIMGKPPGGGGTGTMRVAIVDQDKSKISAKFLGALEANDSLQVERAELEPARESVRRGERVGLLVITPGFGERAGLFWGDPPVIQLGLDPSRTAESAMLEGFVLQSIGGLMTERFRDPLSFQPMLAEARQELDAATDLSAARRLVLSSFLDSLGTMIASADVVNQQEDQSGDGDGALGGELQLAEIQTLDVSRQKDPSSIDSQVQKLRSQWDISFPQAMLWGVLGCIASFAISIARERSMGTMLRLRIAPLGGASLLAGKALACFLTAIGVMVMMTVLGLMLGMRPASYGKLVVAGLCIAAAFTGIMMVVSLLGRTEQGVSGAGWAANLIMAMLGGCMVPVMFMPQWVQSASVVSPVRWAILAIEGAVWREFSWPEMALPLLVLLVTGGVCFAIGTFMFRTKQDVFV